MNKWMITLAAISFSSAVFGQVENDSIKMAKNTMYLELGGNGLLYSLNYERLLPVTNRFTGSGRIGVSMDQLGSYNLPVLVSMIAGDRGNRFEFGIGSTISVTHYSYTNKWSTDFYPTFNVGYRYQKPGGKWMAKVGFTPVYVTPIFKNWTFGKYDHYHHPFIIWFGAGAGWRF